MTTDNIIEVRNVRKRYRLGSEEVWALNGVTMDVKRGEFLAIMGPSGSGKSTLFNQLGALDVPTEGTVSFEGHSIFDMPEQRQAAFRCNKIGYIFQTFNLIPVMSALQNVMLPMTLKGLEQEEAEAAASEILTRVGLGHRLHHKPFELSGGQQQRVAVARALANKPMVVLADEPTGNLDSASSEKLWTLLGDLAADREMTVLMVTHEPAAAAHCRKVFVLRDGRVTGHIDTEGLDAAGVASQYQELVRAA